MWVEGAWHRVHVDQEQVNSGDGSDDAAEDADGLDAVGGDSSRIETGEGDSRSEDTVNLLRTEVPIGTDAEDVEREGGVHSAKLWTLRAIG